MHLKQYFLFYPVVILVFFLPNSSLREGKKPLNYHGSPFLYIDRFVYGNEDLAVFYCEYYPELMKEKSNLMSCSFLN